MARAEIITIGTELLLGEILDSNSQHIARQLREVGIDLYWMTTVGDNESRIADAVRHALDRAEVVLCTGGLGPTVDDVTREGIAAATGRELEFKEELWTGIQERFARFGRTPTENNRRQAQLPSGATALDNPNGTAPAFWLEQDGKLVAAMPGVPREMTHLLEDDILPLLSERYGGGSIIVSRVLHTAGVGESQIDEKIADLERLNNPTVGLAAHTGAVDVRLTAKASSKAAALEVLDELESQVRERLGNWVYGRDAEGLGESVSQLLAERGWKLAVSEAGMQGLLAKELIGAEAQIAISQKESGSNRAKQQASALKEREKTELALVVDFDAGEQRLELGIALPDKAREFSFSYGGSREGGAEWAAKLALSVLRRLLLEEK